jgi:hypothetical protein
MRMVNLLVKSYFVCRRVPCEQPCLDRCEPVWSEMSGELKFLKYAEATCPTTQKRGFEVYAYAEPALREAAWKKLFPGANVLKVSEFEECERYCQLKHKGRLKTLGEPLRKDKSKAEAVTSCDDECKAVTLCKPHCLKK